MRSNIVEKQGLEGSCGDGDVLSTGMGGDKRADSTFRLQRPCFEVVDAKQKSVLYVGTSHVHFLPHLWSIAITVASLGFGDKGPGCIPRCCCR